MLLRPSPELNDRLLGLLGKAQAEFGMVIHAVAVLSNHFHLLVSPTQAHQLADFMGYFTSRLAQEVGRLQAWEGPVFPRRYRARPVSDEEPAQVEWLRYVLAHGCKEGLVVRPEDWPGVHAARALAAGEPLIGHWVDRSALCRARRSVSRPVRIGEYEHEVQVDLAPLPAWQDLSPERYRGRIRELLDETEATAAAERARTRQGVLGVRRILHQDPHQPAPPPERRPMPPGSRCQRRGEEALPGGLSRLRSVVPAGGSTAQGRLP